MKKAKRNGAVAMAMAAWKQARINRKYKDILFRFVLADKKALLALYNALNGTDYADERELEFNTIEDVIYVGYKNDLSFIIGNTLNLYEHQSTINPNIPLRGLRYLSLLYNAHVAQTGADEYGTRLIRLPYPQFVVFYNGTDHMEERRTLKLSDAYHDMPDIKDGPCLEVTATVININYGNNVELLHKCRKLEEYAIFLHRLRGYVEQGMAFETALRRAVDECIEQDILRDILLKSRSEVIGMMLTKYNRKLHYKHLREEGREEGREEATAEL